MLRPNPERYSKALGEIMKTLGAVEKLELYETGQAPSRLDAESRKLLHANIEAVYHETAVDDDYEGSIGVSPRSIRTLLLDAAQRSGYACLSPFAVLEELAELCKGKEELEWLKLDVEPGGYHDHAAFLRQVRERLLDRIDVDMRQATALIDPAQFGELLDRYVQHVSVWVKGEKIRNPVTKRDEEPDAKLMKEVEGLLGVTSKNEEHRRNLISVIAAWAIDHPGEMPAPREVLTAELARIQASAFERLRKQYAHLLRDTVTLLRDDGKGLEPAQRTRAEEVVTAAAELGYCRHCTLELASALLGERYRELVT
jgi:predicted Ser/Thr protein kinase